ncbi:unnamed protein product [Mytilus edulis]|uniref:HEPN domain-containing protein n=1 Tax=Mytilus edulis TaxID=6550 RepID=A0A8S3UCT0_MYTED|nr:unnamed protein product [Mytilus edulis]
MLQTTMVDGSQIDVDESQTESDESRNDSDERQTESDESRIDFDESQTDIDEKQIDFDDLILMTTDYRLVPSSEIFLETRDDERQRIMKNGTLNLLADLTIFSLSKSQIEEIFMKLPKKLRPIFANTSIYEEVISTDELFLNSDIADKLKDYLTSDHFLKGILRLAKYNASSRNRQIEESSLLDIESNLKTIQICTVKQLQTILTLNTRRLNETEVSKRCYLDKKKNILYFTSFDVEAVKWLSLYDLELASAIAPLWNGNIEKDQILKILSKIDLSPLEFSKRLDDIGIPPMEETGIISFVPLPGSLVPKDLAEYLVPLEYIVPLKSFVVYSDWENAQRYKYGVVLDVILSDEQNAEYILNVGSSSPRNMHMSELFMIKEISEINSETFHLNDDEYSHRSDLTLSAAMRFRMNQQPNPQPDEGRRWLQQAKYDLEVAKLTKKTIDKELSKGYNWICIICQQAAEKAIKGAMYTINADEVQRVHSLTAHIPEGDTELLPIACQLENTIGSIEKMRYPIYRALPADLYEKEDALEALQQIIIQISWSLFVLCDGCPAPPPCTCQSIVIFCANLNLTSVPHFSSPVDNDSAWDLELRDNEIRQIRYGDFKNLKLRKLFISNNKINVIENGTLTGSEDSLLVLHLSNNKLTSIPSDVGGLKHLTDLDIHENPMENINEDIIRNISGSLLSFSFGHEIMTSWPQCLERLTNLTSLSIFSLNIRKIPDDAFNNYSHLNILEIISTKLSTIPTSIGKLLNLQNFNLYNNMILAEDSFPLYMFRNLPNLSSISIVNCSLRSLPLTFSEISSLSFLDIENNPISYVEDGVFDRNVSSKVWFMALKNTRLTSIPRTISNLTALTFLNLINGLIGEIRTEDLKNVTKLEKIVPIWKPNKECI